MSSLVEKHGIVLRNTICILGNKFCRTLFRPPGRRGLSFSAAQATLIADKGQENCQPQFVSDIFHPTHFSVCHPVLRICCPVCIFGPPWVLGVRNLEISRQRRPRNVKTSGLVKFQTIWWIKLRFRISNSLYDHFFPTWINFLGTNFLNLISSFAYFCNRCFWHLLRQREESWIKTRFQQIMVFPGKLPDGSSHAWIQKIWDGIRSGFALHSFADCSPPAQWFWSHPSSEWNLFPSISLPLSATTSSKCFLARFKRPSTFLETYWIRQKNRIPLFCNWMQWTYFGVMKAYKRAAERQMDICLSLANALLASL